MLSTKSDRIKPPGHPSGRKQASRKESFSLSLSLSLLTKHVGLSLFTCTFCKFYGPRTRIQRSASLESLVNQSSQIWILPIRTKGKLAEDDDDKEEPMEKSASGAPLRTSFPYINSPIYANLPRLDWCICTPELKFTASIWDISQYICLRFIRHLAGHVRPHASQSFAAIRSFFLSVIVLV